MVVLGRKVNEHHLQDEICGVHAKLQECKIVVLRFQGRSSIASPRLSAFQTSKRDLFFLWPSALGNLLVVPVVSYASDAWHGSKWM